jgi:hypothetical protein
MNTPKTDALMVELANTDQDDLERLVDFASELERELNEAKARIDELESQRDNWRMSSVCRELEARCAELEKKAIDAAMNQSHEQR